MGSQVRVLYRAPYAKALKSLRFRGFRYFDEPWTCSGPQTHPGIG
nr:MAG TPA: hypothetical protein [Caudoviricetes sp.]